MSIEVQQLQGWIGAEVLDGSGEKLGKLEEIYFREEVALAVSIRSGLVGRKHHAAVLRGASVSRDGLHLAAAAAPVSSRDADRLGSEELTMLAAQDDRLLGMEPGDLESWAARTERLAAQAQAQADAEELEVQASQRAEDEAATALRASEAEREAREAHVAREDADDRARQARAEVDAQS
ncbi:MAG TPA: PRC-barrel domain-containing protein [Beijerinckiaceae bacterium]|nr:PRC-barrel domain-containing protein [Beijerinckiaceae bacterium]